MTRVHTLNLALRFVLELLALAAIGYGGWSIGPTPALRWLLAFTLPTLGAFAWGAFRVSGDGGKPLVETPPRWRLLLEALVFGSAVALLVAAGRATLGAVFAGVVVFHYLVGYPRTLAFLRGERPSQPAPRA